MVGSPRLTTAIMRGKPYQSPSLIYTLCECVFRYREILVSMMDSVLKKVQLRYNINELREIDDDTVDDDVSLA